MLEAPDHEAQEAPEPIEDVEAGDDTPALLWDIARAVSGLSERVVRERLAGATMRATVGSEEVRWEADWVAACLFGCRLVVEVADGRPVYTHAPDCAYTLARALFAPPWRTGEKDQEKEGD